MSGLQTAWRVLRRPTLAGNLMLLAWPAIGAALTVLIPVAWWALEPR